MSGDDRDAVHYDRTAVRQVVYDDRLDAVGDESNTGKCTNAPVTSTFPIDVAIPLNSSFPSPQLSPRRRERGLGYDSRPTRFRRRDHPGGGPPPY